jgi:hypothetical protein
MRVRWDVRSVRRLMEEARERHLLIHLLIAYNIERGDIRTDAISTLKIAGRGRIGSDITSVFHVQRRKR